MKIFVKTHTIRIKHDNTKSLCFLHLKYLPFTGINAIVKSVCLVSTNWTKFSWLSINQLHPHSSLIHCCEIFLSIEICCVLRWFFYCRYGNRNWNSSWLNVIFCIIFIFNLTPSHLIQFLVDAIIYKLLK